MQKLNLLFFLNAYSDANSSNAPSQNNFKWNRNINGLQVNDPIEYPITLAPGESKSIFDATRTLAQDLTTQYSISLKPLASSTYILAWTGGTNPVFRTLRANGADATTQVTVTQNGPILTFASTGGTAFNLAAVQDGDFVRIGNLFNTLNQGEWQIIAHTATSFDIVNQLGVAEGPITLGAGFASQVSIYSAAGVQAGDTLKISAGFSPFTWNSYKITAVGADFLEFSSIDILPQEGPITTEVAIYEESKQLLYLEADQHVSMIINGVAGNEVEPFVEGNSSLPGIFVRKSTMFSLSVANVSENTAKLWIALVG